MLNWNSFDSVRAVWSTDFECISTVLDSEGVCYVPQEVLKRTGNVMVNLVGSIAENDELTDRLTTYPVVALVINANAKVCGTETAEVTPSQFEQFVHTVIDEVAKIKDIESVELNDDYTLTIKFSDDTETTVGPIRGEKGDTGPTGNGIAGIVKTGTADLVDTYTITYTNGQTTTFRAAFAEGRNPEFRTRGERVQGQRQTVDLVRQRAKLPVFRSAFFFLEQKDDRQCFRECGNFRGEPELCRTGQIGSAGARYER